MVSIAPGNATAILTAIRTSRRDARSSASRPEWSIPRPSRSPIPALEHLRPRLCTVRRGARGAPLKQWEPPADAAPSITICDNGLVVHSQRRPQQGISPQSAQLGPYRLCCSKVGDSRMEGAPTVSEIATDFDQLMPSTSQPRTATGSPFLS
jgi:hypothetical protein